MSVVYSSSRVVNELKQVVHELEAQADMLQQVLDNEGMYWFDWRSRRKLFASVNSIRDAVEYIDRSLEILGR